MSGRSRRTASSSAAPTSRSSVPWKLETSVLRTIPATTPEDQIPTFELVDAEVLKADGQTLANPLDLQLHGPFIVRGFLMIDDATQRTHLITQGRKNRIPLLLNQVERYSVGIAAEDEEGLGFNPPLLWIRGKCGYHEFSPARHYLPIHRQTNEAIAMYYSFEEYYSTGKDQAARKPSKKGKPLRVESLVPLFLYCALQLGNGWTMEDITQKCHDLAHFIISQFFTTMRDVLEWETTYFHDWMKQEHKDLYHRIKDAYVSGRAQVEKRPADVQRSASLSQTPNPVSLPSQIRSSELTPTVNSAKAEASSNDAAAGPVRQRQRSTRSRSLLPEESHVLAERPAPKSKMALPAQAPSSTPQAPNDSPTAVDEDIDPFESLRLALEGVYDKTKNLSKLSDQFVANRLYFDYRWPTYKNGQSGCHKIPVLEVFHYNAAQLLKVLDKTKWGGTPFWAWLEAKAEEPFRPVAMALDKFPYPVVPRKKMENIARKGTAPTPNSTIAYGYGHGDNKSYDHYDDFETPGRGMGKTPVRPGKSVLRPATTLRKRSLESDSEEGSPVAKRSHFFASDADDDQQLANDDEDEDEEAQIKLVVRADRIPSTTPHGSDGTWVCDEENCNYIVRGGDAEECRERIQQHLATHEQEAERVQLALTEGTRNHSSISHLLDRIREYGEKTQKTEEISIGGVILPKPIQRKMIV